MKSITFAAQAGGDGECFCWNTSSEVVRLIIGNKEYEEVLKENEDIESEGGIKMPLHIP